MMAHTNEELIIIGGGGLGREVYQYLNDCGLGDVKGFLDDRPPSELRIPNDLPLLGTIAQHEPTTDERFVLAVGDPAMRESVAARLQSQGAHFISIVHPRAYVAASAIIGRGSIIAPFASVGASARLGEFCQVHFYASAAHDSDIGPFSALSPYAVVNGGGRLGTGVFMGTRATVNPGRSVGDHSKVAAGAVVYQNVPEQSLAAGNPAKARRLMRGTPHELQPTDENGEARPGDARRQGLL